MVLRTALLFVRSAVRLVYADPPEPVAVCSPKQALCELGDRVPEARGAAAIIKACYPIAHGAAVRVLVSFAG